jgi:hypothetical protein
VPQFQPAIRENLIAHHPQSPFSNERVQLLRTVQQHHVQLSSSPGNRGVTVSVMI